MVGFFKNEAQLLLPQPITFLIHKVIVIKEVAAVPVNLLNSCKRSLWKTVKRLEVSAKVAQQKARTNIRALKCHFWEVKKRHLCHKLLLHPHHKLGFINAGEYDHHSSNSYKPPRIFFSFYLKCRTRSQDKIWDHQEEIWQQPCPSKEDHRLHYNIKYTVDKDNFGKDHQVPMRHYL